MMAPEDVKLCMDGWCARRGCGGYTVFLVLERREFDAALSAMQLAGADNLGYAVLDLVGYAEVCRQAWCGSCQRSVKAFDMATLRLHADKNRVGGDVSEEDSEEESTMGFCVRCSPDLPEDQAYVVCVRQWYANGVERWVCHACQAFVPDSHLDPQTRHIRTQDPQVDSDSSGHMPRSFDWSDSDIPTSG